MTPTLRPIPQRSESGPAPLSFAQQRLWFLNQLRPNDSAYNLTQVLRLTGPLDVPALERALNEIRRRHAVLRANFDTVDDQPVQIVTPFQPVPLTVVDCTNLPDSERERACQHTTERYSRPPFNLKTDSLVRLALVRLRTTEHVLVLALHHIIFDGWSTRLFTAECADLYDAFSQGKPSPLPELPIQYSDYARWQREWLQGSVLEQQLSYWTTHLAGSSSALELPADRGRPSGQTSSGAYVSGVLPVDLLQSLKSLSRRHNATLFMTLLAALQTLLHRLSGQDDIIVGTPFAGRTQLETEKLLGLFINTVPIRINLSANPTFETLLGRVRSVMIDAINHQELPFEKLVAELQPERSLSQTPLFQVMLNAFLLEDPEIRTNDLRIESRVPLGDESKFDLTMYVLHQRQDLRVELRYKADLFDAPRMREMLDQFFSLLQQIVAAPDRAIGSYSLVSDHSRQFLPDPTAALPQPQFALVADLFRSRAKQFPKQKAVAQAGHSWTYEELSASSEAIARRLVTRGLGPKEVVAVMGPRSVGLVAGVVSVFMSGGVLLTLDRSLPVTRQRLILKEARAAYLLYVGEWRALDDWLHEIPGLEIIRVTTQAEVAEPSAAVSLPDISPDDPAYIFFTSGTTGIPKGVQGCHKGLSQFLSWQQSTFDVGPDDHCAQLTSLSFEVILRDIFLPLVSGATLCLPDEAEDPASDRMLAWMDREGITVFHAVPTLAQTWLGAGSNDPVPRQLRWAFFGGEPLTDMVVQRWRNLMPKAARIVNLYGPAETTLAKCFHVISDAPSTGIQHLGKPLPHTQALVLNGGGQLCGVGEAGEIVVRTPFRTLGYINAPEEQQKRFVRNPFRDDSEDLIYFTGDRGRYRADGVLEFLGRIDDQVKIRGVRIEPAEVTAILGRHPQVKACFVTSIKDSQDENILVAYVVPAAANTGITSDLRSYVGEQLPAVMVPSAFVFLEGLPVSPNGKIDRRALPAPDLAKADVQNVFVPPRTPAEHSLRSIWCRVLKREHIGVQDNFFDLGGHSLIATQLVSQIRREFNVEVPLDTVFVKPTIESLALYLLERQARESGPDEIEELLAEVESLSEESANNEVRSLTQEGTSAAAGFLCPPEPSPFFGRRQCNLVLVINEQFDRASFERVARIVRELDSTINVVVVPDAAMIGERLPQLPTLTISPALIRHHVPQMGRVFAGYPLGKSDEYTALTKAHIPVPKWALLTEDASPKLTAFDRYVVQKPNYGGMSEEIAIVAKSGLRWKPLTTWAAGRSDSIIVQQFIYTGERPVSYRVNTLFGRVLYSIKQIAGDDRPALAAPGELPDALTESGFTISASGPGTRAELNFDEEIIRLGERAHAAFPEIPLLGLDIVREVPSGTLYVLEANAIGYVWRFQPPSAAHYGLPIEQQFDGVRKAAYIMAERTQECAR